MSQVLLRSMYCALVVPLLFWLSGFDFDTRGITALCCALCTILAFVFATVIQLAE